MITITSEKFVLMLFWLNCSCFFFSPSEMQKNVRYKHGKAFLIRRVRSRSYSLVRYRSTAHFRMSLAINCWSQTVCIKIHLAPKLFCIASRPLSIHHACCLAGSIFDTSNENKDLMTEWSYFIHHLCTNHIWQWRSISFFCSGTWFPMLPSWIIITISCDSINI